MKVKAECFVGILLFLLSSEEKSDYCSTNSSLSARTSIAHCLYTINFKYLYTVGLLSPQEIIAKNPLRSRSIHITGKPSKTTEPYTIEQMRFLVQSIDLLSNATDRRYLALQALHPLRLEEVLGLQWQDVDLKRGVLHIERAVTHPTRNEPHIKPPKTLASRRTLHLAPQIACYLIAGAPSHFVLGGEKPLTYTQTVKMYRRIQRETQFEEKISPRRFRTTVLTDLYDTTRDIKLAQMSAGHTTAAMTLKHYVRGRNEEKNTALPVANLYGLTDY